jgi:mannose-1-phosphate guanylyltransferase
VYGLVQTGYWRDFGTPADFVEGSADLVRGIAPSPAVPEPGELLVLPGAHVDDAAKVSGGTAVGRDALVDAGARVEGAVLFDGAHVEPGAVVRRSVVGAGARIGRDAVVEDAVIGDRAVIGAGVELRAGARVWPDVTIPERGIRFSSDV